MCILIELSLFWVEPGGKSTKREQRFSRCSLSLLVCHKARNTIDENVFRLCGVQTLSALVEQARVELASYRIAKRLSTRLCRNYLTASPSAAEGTCRQKSKCRRPADFKATRPFPA